MNSEKSVLITGCSSGIGYSSAVYLAKRGFTVFASVRQESDAIRLSDLKLPGLIPVCPLDLTNPAHIIQAEKFISSELTKRSLPGLYALINNAGGGFIAPLELSDITKLRAEFETRIIGPVNLIQLFLPHIRRMRGSGRILWINTPAILPIPYDSSIHAPDFAVNCIIRTLRKEIGLSIPVVMIRCGMINTASPAKSVHELEQNLQSWPEDKLKYYSNALQKVKKPFGEGDKSRTDPEEVAKIIERALSVKRPLKKYRVGHLSFLSAMLEYLPQGIIDRIMPDYR